MVKAAVGIVRPFLGSTTILTLPPAAGPSNTAIAPTAAGTLCPGQSSLPTTCVFAILSGTGGQDKGLLGMNSLRH